MGRVFLQHLGGTRTFSCASCNTYLTNRKELMSTRFTGTSGRAYLFNKVVNITESNAECRIMITGRHMVRDIFCKKCENTLGWMYEFAVEDAQRFKEGKIVLERALIVENLVDNVNEEG